MRKIIALLLTVFLLPTFSILVYSSNDAKDEITVEDIVEYAEGYVGYSYCYGATGPYSFDCSGFVQYVYNNFGYDVGRTSTNQYYAGEKIELKDLHCGDILIFVNTYERGISHSGIYIGDGEFIHAANSRKGVCISQLEDYYLNHFYCGIRVIEEKEVAENNFENILTSVDYNILQVKEIIEKASFCMKITEEIY